MFDTSASCLFGEVRSDFKVFVSRRDPMKLMDLKGTFPQT